jgi:hypothetical protein
MITTSLVKPYTTRFFIINNSHYDILYLPVQT